MKIRASTQLYEKVYFQLPTHNVLRSNTISNQIYFSTDYHKKYNLGNLSVTSIFFIIKTFHLRNIFKESRTIGKSENKKFPRIDYKDSNLRV